MNKLFAALVSCCFILFATSVNAALLDRDSYTTDTKSQLDWLDLNILNGYSYSAVSAGALGYTSSGWRYATFDEVVDLFTRNIGPAIGGYQPPESLTPNALSPDYFEDAYHLVVMMGMNIAFHDSRATYNVTWDYPDLHQVSIQGYFNDGNPGLQNGLAEVTAVLTPSFYGREEPFGRWFVSNDWPLYGGVPFASSFLVRPSHHVPEPGSALLIAIGVLGYVIVRRSKRRPYVHGYDYVRKTFMTQT